nr:hypothetical protein Iba_scaffold22022CG0010 [Ipomoea batatas]
MSPSSITALLIFLNNSYNASISLTLNTVSRARASGFCRPLGCLAKSVSQQFATEANKCFTPSRHGNMVSIFRTLHAFQERSWETDEWLQERRSLF